MGFSEEEKKVERTVPVQSRVDLVTLSNLHEYWSASGVQVSTVSRLVRDSLDLLVEVLRKNEVVKFNVSDVRDAWRYLGERGLYQAAMKKRGEKKVSAALAFDSLRMKGIDPKGYVSQQFNILHNKKSVTVGGREIAIDDKMESAMREYGVDDPYVAGKLMIQRELFEENEKKRMMKEEMKRARECGVIVETDEGEEGDNNVGGIREGMSKEELDRYEEKREREVRERENKEFRMEDLPIVKGEGEDGE
jgi:hypothetical protein